MTDLGEEDSVLWFVALDGWDEPGLVAGRGRGRGGRAPVLLLLLSLLGCGLSGDGTVPLGNPSEVKEEIASQPLLVVGNLALSGNDGN